MTGAEAISSVISYYDGSDPTDSDQDRHRLRLLHWLQHIYEYVWNYREWEWTFKSDSIDNNLPADFMEFGRNGGLWSTETGERWHEESKYTIARLNKEARGTSQLKVFALSSGSLNGAIVTPINTPTNFDIYYRRIAETIADDEVALITPDKYCRTVILPGLIFRAQHGKNDARSEFGGMFREGLAQMCANENPVKTSMGRMPMALGPGRGW
jgi:hypothetical protein